MKQGEAQPVPNKARDRWQQRSRAFVVRAALAEAALERARQRVAAVERVVRHDVRTPLTVILGHTQMLAEGLVAPARIAESYEVMQRQCARLNGLMEQLASSSAPPSPGLVAWVACAEERASEVQDALRGLPVCVCEPAECAAWRDPGEPLIFVESAFEADRLRELVQNALDGAPPR